MTWTCPQQKQEEIFHLQSINFGVLLSVQNRVMKTWEGMNLMTTYYWGPEDQKWVASLCLVSRILDALKPVYPIGSMYRVITYIWLIFIVNVGKYTIHGPHGHYTLPETNIISENRPSQKGMNHLPSIDFLSGIKELSGRANLLEKWPTLSS